MFSGTTIHHRGLNMRKLGQRDALRDQHWLTVFHAVRSYGVALVIDISGPGKSITFEKNPMSMEESVCYGRRGSVQTLRSSQKRSKKVCRHAPH